MKLPDGKIYSCPEICSIPRHVYFLVVVRFLPTCLYTATKTMKLMPAIRGSARGHVNSVNVSVINPISMGSSQARITYAG